MCASIPVPHARFLICGAGGAMPVLRRQAAEQGIADRVEFRGFVEDIGRAIAEMDVFGYPLAEGTYAASELVLQEAMYAGVPPVVLGGTAVRGSVVHAIEAERRIARSPMVVATGGGGVLHYRDHYPDDSHLRLWSGLVLHGQGRPGLAAGEFSAAIRLGLDHWRVSWYLALAAEAAGQTAVMEEALRAVPKPLPPVAEGVFA